jgi:uncharacterized RDD family membrane protein YckC
MYDSTMTYESPEIIDAEPQQLASVQARLGSFLLDCALLIVTLFIGWVIWNLYTWKTGQTPAKRILKQVVVDAKTGEVFNWSRMALREFAVKGAAGNIASGATSGITFVIDSLFVFREDRRTVHDLIVGSKVIQL